MKVEITTAKDTHTFSNVSKWDINHTDTGYSIVIDAEEVLTPIENKTIESISTTGFAQKQPEPLNTEFAQQKQYEDGYSPDNLPSPEDRLYMTVPRDLYYVFGEEAYSFIVLAARIHRPANMFSDTILDVINEIASPVEKQTFNMNVYDHAAPGNTNRDPHLETKVELSNMPDEKHWLPAAMYEVADKSVANDLIAGAANKLGKNKDTTYEDLLVDLCRTYLSDAQLNDIPYDIKPKEGDMWEKAKSSH